MRRGKTTFHARGFSATFRRDGAGGHCAGSRDPLAVDERVAAGMRECGHEVIVANPGRLRLLTTSNNKNDPQDARTLAEIAWAKPALLHPVRHRSAEAQRDLNLVRARDLLVEARTKLINGVRCLVKGSGARVPKCASGQFCQQAHEHLPEEARPATGPLLEVIDELSVRIGEYDEMLEHVAETRYRPTTLP